MGEIANILGQLNAALGGLKSQVKVPEVAQLVDQIEGNLRHFEMTQDVAEAGMELLFHRVAVKPGKPILAGRCGSCLVLGLPGNPVSAYAGFAIFVAPALLKMMGARRWKNQEITARLAKRLHCGQGRTDYRLARLEPDKTGFIARIVPSTGSGDLLSMTRANGFVIVPAAAGDLEPGTELQAMLWRDFHLRV